MEVFKIDQDKLSILKRLLLKNESAKPLPPTNPNEDFRIGYLDGVVVGYISGKIVANTLASVQLVSETLAMLLVGEKEYGLVIGSDEAGKGEWLGPMTIGAVALTPEQSVSLVAKGVMDSKLVKKARIPELSEVIKANCLAFRVVLITPERFNTLLKEVRDERKGLNDMLAWGHAKAIETVYNNLGPNRPSGAVKVIIDEFDKLKTERRLDRVLDLKSVVLVQEPRAEREPAVAAASLVAKAAYESWVDKEAGRLGIPLRKLSQSDAKKHPRASYFSKMSYLR